MINADTLPSRSVVTTTLPFDSGYLDNLLEAAGIDVLLVTSKHNIRYLFGGYWFSFFDQFDAIGITRYLPILIYPKGRPENAVYIGNLMEESEVELGRFWCPTVETKASGTLDAVGLAIKHIWQLGIETATIGVEASFFPGDALDALRSGLAGHTFADGQFPLERLRAVKTADELKLIREASERVIEAMVATFASCRPGMTKKDLTNRLRQEEVERGLSFDYCLLTAGTGLNRSPSDQVIKEGDIISLDSGRPDAELEELLAWVDEIQQKARKPIRAEVPGREIFQAVDKMIARSPYAARTHFVAHGVGLISHEAPRLTDTSPVNYPAYDRDLPLQAGMVLSIETTLLHPVRGFIKLEDTLSVTADGWVAYGDGARGWNVCASTS
jgi:Xaa-Pro aminopeptidase